MRLKKQISKLMAVVLAAVLVLGVIPAQIVKGEAVTEYKWLAGTSAPTELGLNSDFASSSTSAYSNSAATVFTDNVFGTTGNISGQKYVAVGTSTSIGFTPQVSGTIKIYAVSDDNSKTGTYKVYNVTEAADVKSGEFGTRKNSAGASGVEVAVKAGCEYTISNFSRSAYFYGIVLTPSQTVDPDPAPVASVTLDSASLTLDGKIGMNFYYTETNMPEGYEAEFYLEGDLEPFETVAPTAVENSTQKVVTCMLSAQQASKNVTVKFRDTTDTNKYYDITNSNSATEDKTTYTYSVAAYKTAVENDAGSTNKLKELVSNLDTYSSLAFAHFNGETASAGTLVEASTVETTGKATYNLNDAAGTKLYKGSSLVLNGKTSIKHYFEDLTDYNLTTSTLPEGISASIVGNCVVIDNISAQDLDEVITVTLTKGGTTVSVEYSALTYVRLALGRTSSSTSLKSVVSGLYNYWNAAQNYFTN